MKKTAHVTQKSKKEKKKQPLPCPLKNWPLNLALGKIQLYLQVILPKIQSSILIFRGGRGEKITAYRETYIHP